MRNKATGRVLTVKAVSGTHVVILAWDGDVQAEYAQGNLLGFAIERTEFDTDGKIDERYWLRGIKRFKNKDKGLQPGTPVPTSEHPIQSFQWGDYTAESGKAYSYKVIPVTGKPMAIVLHEANSTEVMITTELQHAPDDGADTPRHDIFFNRGVMGSQAYAREFGNVKPNPENPDSPEMKWLSRGLHEALLEFIALADDDSYALRGAFYEFHYPPVVVALAAAQQAGADVQIIFDAESSYKTENAETIASAGLTGSIPRTVTSGIRHNKFLVLLKDNEPLAVLTGSTNISSSGIFGHLNVAHIVWSAELAQHYLAYWIHLQAGLTPAKLIPINKQENPTPSSMPKAKSVLPLFSARDGKGETTTMDWYARLLGSAQRISCFSAAFAIDKAFQTVFQQENDVLRYIVKDDDLTATEKIGRDHDVLFAAGGRFKKGEFPSFLAERDNSLSSNNFIHTKFVLVDPLGDDPIVVTGSANFSQPSQQSNDENMLVIRGETRVADIYFGEFMRIFDHHYARYLAAKLQGTHPDPNSGYLKESATEWVPSHFQEGNSKEKRRRYFVE